MAVNAGQIQRFQLGGIEYDPMGDWTIVPTFTKKELTEKTPGNPSGYYKKMVSGGKITGQIAIREDQDTDPVRNAESEEFFIETAAGNFYNGNVTYVADGEESQSDGSMQIELEGLVEKQ